MKKLEIVFQLDKSMELIDKLERPHKIEKFEIGEKIFDCSIELQKGNRKYTFNSEDTIPGLGFMDFNLDSLTLEFEDIPKIFIPHIHFSRRTNKADYGNISNFQSVGFDEKDKRFYRLVIPYYKKPNFIQTVELTSLAYNYSGLKQTKEGTEINIRNKDFTIFKADEKIASESKTYIVVQGKSKLSYISFREYCYSILLSFGYISGKFIQDEGYFIQYEQVEMDDPVEFKYAWLNDSIHFHYNPVNNNPHSRIWDSDSANTFSKLVRGLSKIEFSKLCESVYENEDMKSVLLLILESSKSSLVSSPACISVAMETLANIMKLENEEAYTPINDKTLAKKIRKDLNAILENYKTEILENNLDALNIIRKRIENFNQLTNKDRLLNPYKILNFQLNKKDIEAIEMRNSLLHGREPLEDLDENSVIEEQSRFRYYLYLKLITLVSIIILKRIGFDNMIFNYAKLHEKSTGVTLKEGYYRQL